MRATVAPTRVLGFEALVMENADVRAVILPTLGGRVWQLDDRQRGRQWIWQRPGVALRPSSPGEAYDDVWAGGWEELFPNDAAGPFEGRTLPDHGEWWTLAWRVETTTQGEVARVRLAAESTIVRAGLVKEFVLPAAASTLSVRYRIESREPAAFHYLFKQHLPIAITPDCRLRLPGGSVEAVEPGFGTLLPADGSRHAWPMAGDGPRAVDLQVVPPAETRAREFVYVRDLPAGWCGVDDVARGAALRFEWNRQAFPYAWLFLAYGGWRDVYTAVLEPCTNLPKDLAGAVAAGQAAQLRPGSTFETAVSVTVGPLEGPGR